MTGPCCTVRALIGSGTQRRRLCRPDLRPQPSSSNGRPCLRTDTKETTVKMSVGFSQKFTKPAMRLLSQGTSPEKLALSITSGLIIGILPILGTTSLLCAGVALIFRLNLPVVQLANYLVYPLQLLLVIPFVSMGAFLFNAQPITVSPDELVLLFQSDFRAALAFFADLLVYATVTWLIGSIPLSVLLYSVVVFLFRQVRRASRGRGRPVSLSTDGMDG